MSKAVWKPSRLVSAKCAGQVFLLGVGDGVDEDVEVALALAPRSKTRWRSRRPSRTSAGSTNVDPIDSASGRTAACREASTELKPTVAPWSWRALAMPQAIEWSLATPKTRAFLPSSSPVPSHRSTGTGAGGASAAASAEAVGAAVGSRRRGLGGAGGAPTLAGTGLAAGVGRCGGSRRSGQLHLVVVLAVGPRRGSLLRECPNPAPGLPLRAVAPCATHTYRLGEDKPQPDATQSSRPVSRLAARQGRTVAARPAAVVPWTRAYRGPDDQPYSLATRITTVACRPGLLVSLTLTHCGPGELSVTAKDDARVLGREGVVGGRTAVNPCGEGTSGVPGGDVAVPIDGGDRDRDRLAGRGSARSAADANRPPRRVDLDEISPTAPVTALRPAAEFRRS